MMSTTTTPGTPTFLSEWAPRLLSVLRIMSALLFLSHGTQKILGFPPMAGGRPLPEAFTMSWSAGVLELVGGVLLALGLFTRPVAFVLSGEMAFAYFIGHAPRGFFPALNGGDAAILFCFVFLYLAAAGPGPWSLDAMRTGRGGDALTPGTR
jgi:putative oxidoreductase